MRRAAALARRAFPFPGPTRDLSVEGRQAALALSLVDPQQGLTAGEIGHLLAVGREQALEALAELVALDLAATTEPLEGEAPDADDSYCLTMRGMETAEGLATVVRRAIPGWPPPHRMN
jgi:hypothetical protein